MQKSIIIDTGVLVAFLMPSDRYHQWSISSLKNVQYPILTCEPVLTEACFLLQRIHLGHEKILQLVRQGYKVIANGYLTSKGEINVRNYQRSHQKRHRSP